MALSGHAHLYERYSYNGITYITSGGGGSELSPIPNTLPNLELREKKFNYCLFDISPGKISLRMFDQNGNENIESTPFEITRPPLSTVLIVDRSGSMSEQSGIPGKKKVDAANLYIDLLEDVDEIGIVRYNHLSDPADEIFTLQSAGGGGKTTALDFLTGAATDSTKLLPSGGTSIGAGISRASTVLSLALPKRAMVVLTDGIHNSGTSIEDGLLAVQGVTPTPKIFAVGFGANQLTSKLQQITSTTNGYASIADELSGANEFLLQKLYVQILADASDEVIVTDPYLVLKPGEKEFTEINLGETEMGADFILLFRQQGEFRQQGLQFWLEAPNGTLIESSDVSTLPNISFTHRDGHMFFRCHFPVFQDDSMAQFGKWKHQTVLQLTDIKYYAVLFTNHSAIAAQG